MCANVQVKGENTDINVKRLPKKAVRTLLRFPESSYCSAGNIQ